MYGTLSQVATKADVAVKRHVREILVDSLSDLCQYSTACVLSVGDSSTLTLKRSVHRGAMMSIPAFR